MARGPDLVGLTVLALLSVRPSHPYELHRMILDTHKDYVTGLPRSLYHAIDRLAGEELIVPVETSRQGRRPERTVYRLTDEGRAELTTRLRRLLEEPGPDTRALTAALSLIGGLPVREAERALLTRAAVLESAVFACDAHLRNLRDNGLPPLLTLELECERALRGAELDWVRGVLDRLASGELAWPDHTASGGTDGQDPAV
ncbi:PadR family transcriptional regulator [Streptosporangium saharense]|uniref:DNA-binding PadR family transcriptional regulator n=1 Tax=Streptosporangium saharense TaxID=1706840 RepID=A0A7W7VNK3_9ACTN|nr:PadR family transcriptional regulator [Streptosporangium saharense]MBB4916932.1 DNA-binding PadR family transcriptional regulator [Streptosporangium saharense]